MALAQIQTQESTVLQKAFHAGEELTKLGWNTLQIKHKVEEAVEDGIRTARRAAKKGQYKAEDMLDDATYRIKHDPLRSVAVSFGVGISLGAMIGWLVSRKGCACKEG